MRRAFNWLMARFFCRLADAHRHFGNQYGDQQEHWAAVENYTRSVTLDPSFARAYLSRGILYWREIGNYHRAIQDLTRVLELEPSCSEAYFNRALAYRMHRDWNRAIADFQAYLAEGTDDFWLDSAQRQLIELQASAKDGAAR